MIEDGQRKMRLPLPIRFHEQIAAPDAITRHRAWDTVFQFLPNLQNQMLLSPAGVHNIGLTDRHLSSLLPPPVEVMGDGATPCLRHERFESNDFVLDPLGFGLGKNATG
jgi:hypothetical protein